MDVFDYLMLAAFALWTASTIATYGVGMGMLMVGIAIFAFGFGYWQATWEARTRETPDPEDFIED